MPGKPDTAPAEPPGPAGYRPLGYRLAPRRAGSAARRALPRRSPPAPSGSAAGRKDEGAAGRGPLAVGRRFVVTFDRMGPDGEALASVAGRTIAVPYAAPGEEAVIEIERAAPREARGRLVELRRQSPRVAMPACPHFGRCGGCQWQHLDYRVQLAQKTLLVRDVLAGPGLRDLRVEPALGWEPPWGFRTRFVAAADEREGRPVLGFYAWGGGRVVDVRTCPVQHPANAALLGAVREAWPALAAAAGGAGRLRGVHGRVGAATGEVLLGLAVSEPLTADGRMAAVRALLDRVCGLVGILEARVPRRGHLLTPRRTSLLWGRRTVREEVAGVRYQVPLRAEFPDNARALAGVIELILGALNPGAADAVFEPDCGIGAYTLHLALAAGRAVGVTDKGLLAPAWENARLNRLGNCAFYTRDPLHALDKARRRGPVRLALLHPAGAGLAAGFARALRKAGVVRLVYLGRLRPALARDAVALRRAGYRIARVQPFDTSPHTSHVGALLTATIER